MTDYTRISITWDRITEDCRALALSMRTHGIVTENTKGFVALARGGLAVGQLLGYYLDIRRIETVSVASYEDTKAIEQKLTGTPSPDIGDGAGWVVVDDLVDTGGSYRFIKTLLPNATYVALYAKPKGKPDAALSLTTFEQDAWLDFPWEVASI